MGLGIIAMLSVALLLVAVFIVAYIVGIFNNFVRLRNDIDKSFSNIDVLLKQRNDEIPNLVETVKGYMKHERNVIEEITRLRVALISANSIAEKASASNAITSDLKTIFAVAENYPQLKANENFLQLQRRIIGLENEIADRRELYNDYVKIYNTKIDSFPDLIIARLMNFTKKEFFVAAEPERNVVRPGFS